MKKVCFRIRHVYFVQIVSGSKNVELRADSEYWRKTLLDNPNPPKIAVFVCGKKAHRRMIEKIERGKPKEILGRPLSCQGKKDIPTEFCIAVWLGAPLEEEARGDTLT